MTSNPALVRTILALLLCITASGAGLAAQRGPIAMPVDAEMEKKAEHNLDVGRQYFKRKAYAGVKDRMMEVVEIYPEFTKIDEVYLLLARTFVKLDDPDRAIEFYHRLLDERPDSNLVDDAKKELAELQTNTEPSGPDGV